MAKLVKVLVTGVGGRSVGHQVLHALQTRRDAYEIIAVDADSFSFGLYQADKHFLVPFATSPGYIECVMKIVRQESIQVLIPGTEPELKVLAEHRAELSAVGCLLLANPPSVVRLCADKNLLAAWLEGNGFTTPLTVSKNNWEGLVSRVGFPIIAKPSRSSGGSRNVAILINEDEVNDYLKEIGHSDIAFQEYIDAPDDEYTIGVCIDRDGKIIDSIVLRRNLVGLSLAAERCVAGKLFKLSTGYSQGFIIDYPELARECERLALAMGMRGPANFQCRVRDGIIYVFEVHPRFSGTTSIRADVGFNEPDLLIRNFLFGEHIERINYTKDVAAIRALQSIIVPIADLASLRVNNLCAF